jgi:tetratricopeptide (TPR) repeat protein
MAPFAELFDRARHCARSGDLRQAEQLCRRVVQAEPYHAEAWLLLARLVHDLGDPAGAAEAHSQALRLRPESPEVLIGLGKSLAAQGRTDEAERQYREALRVEPGNGDALTQLGVLLAQTARLPDGIVCLRQAVQGHPGNAVAHHNLGVALAESGQKEEAIATMRAALQIDPGYAECHYNLGNVSRDLKRSEEACAAYREAIAHRPDHAGAFNNLGLTLAESKHHAEAVCLLQQATRLQPKNAQSHNNLGLALTELGRFAEAQTCFLEALRLDPQYAEAHVNLGSCYKEQGRLEEAITYYQMALWYRPGLASAEYNRALAWLQAGDYARGWPAYEWRWRRSSAPSRLFARPRWDGSDPTGKTILLWCEQGLGDAIQFARYATVVKARGCRVVLECPPPLAELLRTCPGVDVLVPEGQPLPEYDYQVPVMSLPAVLGTLLDTVPATVPYLTASQEVVARWQQRLGQGGLKVGLVWQGNPRHQWDHWRSIPLARFRPLAQVPGMRLISVQHGPGSEQAQQLKGLFEVAEPWGSDQPGPGPFPETAALMKALDLVITVDSSAAHLAGALGVPVWSLLAAVSDWRWMLERGDTPWYPTMRLFRQQRLGDWAEVIDRLLPELQCLAVARPA